MNNRRGMGYIFPCVLIVCLFTLLWWGSYYVSLVSMIRTQRDTTELAIDSYVTEQSIVLYTSVRDGSSADSSATTDDCTEAVLEKLLDFYPMTEDGGCYYSYFDSGSVRLYISDFSASLASALDTDGNLSYTTLSVSCSYTLHVPYYFSGGLVTVLEIPVNIEAVYSSKND